MMKSHDPRQSRMKGAFVKPVIALFLALAAMPVAYSQGVVVDKFMMITMAVGNMDKAKEFYTTLGLKATQDYSQAGQRWVALSLPGGGPSINLSTMTANYTKPGVSEPGTVVLYFTAFDVAAAHEELSAKGVKVTDVKDDLYGPGSGVKWMSLADPDGNQVLIVQLKPPAQK
jgi:catechol 2,3-dioxygenase-like lactoylglutathione lyase family enzyme